MGLNFYRTRHFRAPSRGGPDKWLRELEEETGAISISRLKQPRGTTSSFNAEPGQSSLTSRRINGQIEDGRKLLPDFTISTYEEMLKLCQRDMRIGCVILVSEEHDDVLEFKRYIYHIITLSHPLTFSCILALLNLSPSLPSYGHHILRAPIFMISDQASFYLFI